MLRWLRKRRRTERNGVGRAPLREFVYLDEVSVYSLIASRVGPVPDEFTATESSARRRELGSSVGLSAGIAKTTVSSRGEATQSKGTQVVSRSNVQAAFKDLVEREQDNFVMRATAAVDNTPQVSTVAALEAMVDGGEQRPWILSTASLKRGELVEAEVELEAEASFRASATISSLMEVVQKTPELLGGIEGTEVRQAIAASRVLDLLHGGLVPLRGRLVHYRAVVVGRSEWLVHEALVNQLPTDHTLVVRPVNLVGVAEADLFWKDIRRVAFSHSRYLVMARVGRDRLQDNWAPMKLVEVLKDFLPEVAGELDAGSRGFLKAITAQDALEDGPQGQAVRMRSALVEYAGALAAQHDHSCDEEDLAAVGLPTDDQCHAYDSVEARRGAFNAITKYVEDRYEIARDSVVEEQLRGGALADAGLGLEVQAFPLAVDAQSPIASAAAERYLDAEFVAIYW